MAPRTTVKVGQVYGRITITGKIKKKKGVSATMWIGLCECGNETNSRAEQLTHGRKVSCGCFRTEYLHRGRSQASLRRECTRRSYDAMLYRCYKPEHHKFPSYGAKGIIVCEKWKNSFEDFVADMGHRPKGTSIDRIDTLGNYEPGNCRWATIREQNENKITTVWVEHGEHRAKLVEVCRTLDLDRHVIYGRLKMGWDLRRALTAPTRPRKPNRQK